MMNRATGEEQKLANMILVELKENPNSWTKVCSRSIFKASGILFLVQTMILLDVEAQQKKTWRIQLEKIALMKPICVLNDTVMNRTLFGLLQD